MMITPMLPVEREEPFDDDRFLYEPLVDGQRLLLAMNGGKTRLLSRHGYDVTRQYPELHNVPLRTPADVVLDGEVAYIDPESGRADFATLQQRFRMTKLPLIRDGRNNCPLTYFVFDIIHYNGIDLKEKPLALRKRLLRRILEENRHFKVLGYVRGEGRKLFRLAGQAGLEGVACKRLDSGYAEGRSDHWIKVPLQGR